MSNTRQPEVWLRGPIPGIAALIQPVAHSLQQCREELRAHVSGLSAEQIWARPAGAASIGFHVRHAAGSLDRLFTYARGQSLSAEQQDAREAEGRPSGSGISLRHWPDQSSIRPRAILTNGLARD